MDKIDIIIRKRIGFEEIKNSFKDLKLEIDSIKKGFKSAKVKRA